MGKTDVHSKIGKEQSKKKNTTAPYWLLASEIRVYPYSGMKQETSVILYFHSKLQFFFSEEALWMYHYSFY